jgi:translation initiation factor 4A
MKKQETFDISGNMENLSSNVESDTYINDWEEIKEIPDKVLHGIYAHGFDKPSPIQSKAIIPLIKGKDVIAQAQSGTGKTGSFAVAVLSLINVNENSCQAIILAHTRELARQICDVVSSISGYLEGFKYQLLVGGNPTELDAKLLKETVPHLIIGCPGRVHDMIRRKHLSTKDMKIIILDEADEMLSPGFKEQVYNIFQYLPKDIQVGLFSATLPSDLLTLTQKFMRDPVKILVKSEMLTLEGITQYYIALEDDGQKYSCLKDLFNSLTVSQCIIYCNSVRRVSDLYEAMKEDKFPVCCIHSGMEKEERNESYNQFKNGKYRVLISSNVTARGIDIQQVSIVVNFDIPRDIHTYLHRIGRSGRWGRKGVGINFVTRRDIKKINEIEAYYNTEIKELPESFLINL